MIQADCVAGPYASELHAIEQSVDSAPPSVAPSSSVPADGIVPPFPAHKLLDAMQTSVKVHSCFDARRCPLLCAAATSLLLDKLSVTHRLIAQAADAADRGALASTLEPLMRFAQSHTGGPEAYAR